ncbi:MAG: HDIG domain-containing protein [Euryarchaeota archaeon]|nr:HDIG domain-containing protein [Euryarchaeota archaeon]
MIPSEERCIRILFDEGIHPKIVRHVCTVMRVAEAIAIKCDANLSLVRAGALLHDLGRSRTQGIRHAIEGATLARDLELPEELVLIIQKHVGAGIEPKNAQELGLPPLDYMPSTLEEKIVCHADNLVDDHKIITLREAYLDFVEKNLEEQGEQMLKMHRDLSEACNMDVSQIVSQINSIDESLCSDYL